MALAELDGDKWNIGRGKGPEVFNPQNAETYGAWLGRRYKDTPNVIWILGGDRGIETGTHKENAILLTGWVVAAGLFFAASRQPPAG